VQENILHLVKYSGAGKDLPYPARVRIKGAGRISRHGPPIPFCITETLNSTGICCPPWLAKGASNWIWCPKVLLGKKSSQKEIGKEEQMGPLCWVFNTYAHIRTLWQAEWGLRLFHSEHQQPRFKTTYPIYPSLIDFMWEALVQICA